MFCNFICLIQLKSYYFHTLISQIECILRKLQLIQIFSEPGPQLPLVPLPLPGPYPGVAAAIIQWGSTRGWAMHCTWQGDQRLCTMKINGLFLVHSYLNFEDFKKIFFFRVAIEPENSGKIECVLLFQRILENRMCSIVVANSCK